MRSTWFNNVVGAFPDSSSTVLVEYDVQGEIAKQRTVGELAISVRQLVSLISTTHPESLGSVVGLHLDRGVAYTEALLACSLMGCFSMPLPLDYPLQRLIAIVQAAAAPLVLVSLDEHQKPPESLCQVAAVLNLAAFTSGEPQISRDGVGPQQQLHAEGGIVLSSSGSTGTPKLIRRMQSSFYHRIEWTHAALPYVPGDVCVQKSAMTTTHSLYELLEPLLAGVAVHVLPEVGQMGLDLFWQVVARLGVTRMIAVPTLLAATLAADLLPACVITITLMGEEPPRPLCEALADRSATMTSPQRVYTIYGSTEASSSMVLDVLAV